MSSQEPISCTPVGQTVDFGEILGGLAGELDQLAQKCALLQGSISALLEKVNHPDLGAEIHMLQDVDRIQQTLSDMAAILGVAHPAAHGVRLGRDEIGAAILLESLRQRLGLSNDPHGQMCDPADMDITWL